MDQGLFSCFLLLDGISLNNKLLGLQLHRLLWQTQLLS